MTLKLAAIAVPLGLALAGPAPVSAKVLDAKAERITPGKVALTWADKNPVDVYLAETPDGGVAKARRIAAATGAGRLEVAVSSVASRPYFLLKDRVDGSIVRTAERVLPLAQGSNFRDVGGYPAAGGKHVRWGRIFRSGGTPLLTDADVAQVRALGVQDLIDLRSSEERSLAPTRLDGIRYSAVGYSMASMMGPNADIGPDRIRAIYRQFPTLLAPQIRILFRTLLAHEGPLAYNCSAGQDRTGFATAVVLGALGVPRDVVLADYHLSTTYRRPEYEMPHLDAAAYPGNAAAALFSRTQQDPQSRVPQPLFDADHRALLEFALAEIDRKWGSVEGYLRAEAGVSAADLTKLRAQYLE